MQIRILGSGTSQGIPVIGCTCEVCLSRDPKDNRTRTSALVRAGQARILIDAGPDFRQQMLAAGEDNLDAILISHEHNDHIGGLDDVRPINFRWRKVIPLYTDARVRAEIEKSYAYIFDPQYQYPGKPRIAIHEHDNAPFFIGEIEIIPVRVYHGALPIWGYRIGSFAYITDAKSIPVQELQKLEDLDVLVLNALQHREHPTHFNFEEALQMIRILQPGKAYLTHLSHDLGTHSDLEIKLPGNVGLCYDGMEIRL